MRLYRNPLEAYRISFESYKKLDQNIKDRMWARFKKHVEVRGFRGMLKNYYQFKAESATIKYNYPNSINNMTK